MDNPKFGMDDNWGSPHSRKPPYIDMTIFWSASPKQDRFLWVLASPCIWTRIPTLDWEHPCFMLAEQSWCVYGRNGWNIPTHTPGVWIFLHIFGISNSETSQPAIKHGKLRNPIYIHIVYIYIVYI